MDFSDQITDALRDHDKWKRRLHVAVETGQFHLPVELVCLDNRCAFGRWLYSLDEDTKSTPRWNCVRRAHADFHSEAARVLELALELKRDAARSALRYPSKFAGLSAMMQSELEAWKREESSRSTAPFPLEQTA